MSPAFPARRRADEFDSLLRGDADASASSELRELASLAAGLSSAVAEPSASFSADLRERLMAAAPAALAADNGTAGTAGTVDTAVAARGRATTDRLTVRRPSTAMRGRRRLTAGVAALAIIGGTAGTALASQNALPGDALYPVKRALESLHSDMAVNQTSKGDDLLADAGDRLTEVHELTRRAPVGAADNAQITATLTTFSEQVQQASQALLQQYQSSHDPRSLAKLRSFASTSMTQLSELAAVLPSAARDALSAAAQTLLSIDQAVEQLCGTTCGPALQLPSSLIESLASSVQHVVKSLPKTDSTTGTGSQTEAGGSGPTSTPPESTAPATKTPTRAPSGTSTSTPPSGGSGASNLSQRHPSGLPSTVSSLLSNAAGGVASAVGGVLGSLLGGASPKS